MEENQKIQKNKQNIDNKNFKQIDKEISPVKVLYMWEAPDRVVKEKSKAWYFFVACIFLGAIMIAIILQEPFFVVALIALMILIYVSQTVPPQIIEHQITNKGIKTLDKLFLWRQMQGFWVSKKSDRYIIIINFKKDEFPQRLIVLAGSGDLYKIVMLLMDKIKYLTQKETGEDIVNIFSFGEYQEVSNWIKEVSN